MSRIEKQKIGRIKELLILKITLELSSEIQ
jgi:hypothetical protein